MKTFMKFIFVSLAVMTAGMANAGIINFISLTESAGGYGEGAWDPLSLSVDGVNVTITGHSTTDDDATQFAYLDWGNAGLGVCKDVADSSKVNTKNAKSGANNCNPSDDDNVTRGEYLRFAFDYDVVISNFWFNNNHDGGMSAGDKVKIGGSDYNVLTGYAGGINGIGSFAVAAGDYIDVAYSNTQFYVSGMEVMKVVPEPGSVILFALGLLSLVSARRRIRG
jgi:hypothetical protein